MEVTIERILPGGLGLAHADGQTVMVALAAPGDRLRVRVDRVKGTVAFASIDQIISPSEARVEPPCPYFGRCGGCDFQQLKYEAQIAAKVEIIKDCLRRIGGIESIPEFQITPASNQWHYRARAQWQYDSVRKRLGYFESGSRRVCDVAECAVLVPALQRTLEDLREKMRDDLLPDEARYFRAILGDGGVAIAPSLSSPTVRQGSPRSLQAEMVTEITHTIHGDTYHLNAESFFQTNTDLLSQLIDAALGEATGKRAVELYCGVGLFTLPLARRFKDVIGIEDDPAAADFARRSLSNADLMNAQIEKADVGQWLEMMTAPSAQKEKRRRAAALQNVDFLLLDPPRTGGESRVISGILNVQPERICYVSCDPATLARDLKKLLAGGYTLDSLTAFDMFPQTHHVETVVHLIRNRN